MESLTIEEGSYQKNSDGFKIRHCFACKDSQIKFLRFGDTLQSGFPALLEIQV